MNGKSRVELISDFPSERWGNRRRIFIYLPPAYDCQLGNRFPVLYMHAGQRLFDQKRDDIESWNVHKAVDRLVQEGLMEDIIVVGIAHLAVDGANEFYYDVEGVGERLGVTCNGLLYEHFIAEELKPYIDARYRTKPEPRHTALMGSSGAALSTFHMGFRRSDIFGKIGLISPLFVMNKLHGDTIVEEKLYELPRTKAPLQIWLDIGTHEGLYFTRYVKEVADHLLSLGYVYGEELAYLEEPEAGHFELDWGRRIHAPLLYFFGRRGSACRLELYGRSQAALQGAPVRLNPVVHFDSGFFMTDLRGTYIVDHPELLEVEADGTLRPKSTGTAVVTYAYGELQISKELEIVPEMSENVTVDVRVTVPPHTPEDVDIYVFKILDRAGPNEYASRLLLPRDTGLKFKITRGFRLFELDANRRPIEYRMALASEPMQLHCTVENWTGL